MEETSVEETSAEETSGLHRSQERETLWRASNIIKNTGNAANGEGISGLYAFSIRRDRC